MNTNAGPVAIWLDPGQENWGPDGHDGTEVAMKSKRDDLAET
jgi:hypothetical protein